MSSPLRKSSYSHLVASLIPLANPFPSTVQLHFQRLPSRSRSSSSSNNNNNNNSKAALTQLLTLPLPLPLPPLRYSPLASPTRETRCQSLNRSPPVTTNHRASNLSCKCNTLSKCTFASTPTMVSSLRHQQKKADWNHCRLL